MDSEEPWHLELPWCAARCGVLVASAAALRKGTAWVSGLALGALFLWSSWELRSARGRLRDRLWRQVAIPLRVCAYAQQPEEAWTPLSLWRASAPGLAAVLQPDFTKARAVQSFQGLQQRVQRRGRLNYCLRRG